MEVTVGGKAIGPDAIARPSAERKADRAPLATLLGQHAINRSVGSDLRELGGCGRELVSEQGAAAHE